MFSDLLMMWHLAQQPYFLCEVLPYWIFILAAPAISSDFGAISLAIFVRIPFDEPSSDFC